jgi:transglutaminase-like putative cysteine protease
MARLFKHRNKPLPPPGSKRGLMWATAAFAGGMLLGADRVPVWTPLVAAILIAWRVAAVYGPVRLPGLLIRSLLAIVLVAGVLIRFHTLNGLSAGTALLLLMGGVKLLETRTQRDQFIVVAAGVFLLLAACLDRQSLVRAPFYLLQAWLCCAALAVVAYNSGATPAPNTSVPLGDRTAVLLAGRSLAFALPLAILMFVFFPRLGGAFWAIPRSDQALTGLSDSMSPGSISELTNSYDVAFRAEFNGAAPPPQERYWRGPVLHEFDGYTWRRSNRTMARMEPLQYLGEQYFYRISLEPSSQRWWFALDTPTRSPASRVFLTYDYQLISTELVTQTTQYSLSSYTKTRASRPLSTLGRRYDIQLPGERNPRSRALAAQLRTSVSSDSAYIDAVLNYFRANGFEYTLTPPRLGPDSIDDFLFQTHLGFCGHYASAFTVLMRAAGIPARVVTGYLGGEWNPVGHYFIVRQSDAHSWAEVWLEDRGWVRVDPTAVVAPERLLRGILDILPDAVSAPARFVWSQPWLAKMLQRWDAVNMWWNDRVIKFNYADQLQLLKQFGFDSPDSRQLGWLFGGGLIAWLLWVAWHMGRAPARPRPDRLARAYGALCRKLARAGVERQAHHGPLALSGEISTRRPDLAADIQPVLARYTQLRYGRQSSDSYANEVRQFERIVSRLKVTARAPEMQPQSQTGL